MRRLVFHVSRLALTVAIVLVLMAGLVLMIAKVSLPSIANAWEVEFQEWLSEQIGRPVIIAGLDVEWQGWKLLLRVSDLRIGSTVGSESAVSTGKVYLGVDLPATLAGGALRLSGIRIEGTRLRAERLREGTVRLSGFNAGQQTLGRETLEHLTWLLTVSWLEIVDSEILLQDHSLEGIEFRFTNVNLDLRNAGAVHQLSLSMGPAPGFADRLHLRAQAIGETEDLASWIVNTHLEAEQVALAALPESLRVLSVTGGRANLELWAQSVGARLETLEGNIETTGMTFAAGTTLTVPEALSTRFLVQADSGAWNLVADWLTLVFPQRTWTVPGFAFQIVPGKSGDIEELRASVPSLSLQPAVNLVHMASVVPEFWKHWLKASRPEGMVRGLELHWRRRVRGAEPGITVTADLSGVGTEPVGKLPGVRGIGGRLRVRGEQINLDLNSREASLTFPLLLRDPLVFHVLDGSIQIVRNENSWRVDAPDLLAVSPDIQTRSRLQLDWYTDRRSPHMDLQIYFRDGDGSQTSRYLPVGIMKPKLVGWLDRAIVNAHVTSGGVIFRGPLRSFPFIDHSGTFLVQFGVEDAILDFHPQWPRAEEMIADITFRSDGMEATASTARLMSLEAIATRVAIPRLRVPVVELSSHVRSQFPLMQEFVDTTPLNASVGKQIRGLGLSGNSRLDLALSLPLAGLKPSITGTVSTEDAAMTLTKWSLPLTDIHGEVEFSELGVRGGVLKARLHDEPVQVSIQGRQRGNSLTTVVAAQGNLSAARYIDGVAPGLASYLQGRSSWKAQVEWNNQQPRSLVTLESGLLGTAVTLPAPLGKDAQAQQPLRVLVKSTTASRVDLEAQYGSELHLLAHIGGDFSSPVLERGSLLLGSGQPELAVAPGLMVRGRIPVLELDGWMALLGANQVGSPAWLRGVEVAVDELHVADRTIRQLGLEADAEVWTLAVSDPDFSGTVRGSIPLHAGPVVASLQHLNLDLASGDEQESEAPSLSARLDPRELPPLRVQVDALNLDRSPSGSLTLETRPVPQGLELSRLELVGEQFDLQAKGSWRQAESGAQAASIQAQLQSEDLGGTLRDLGLYADVDGASGELTLDASWPGALTAPGLSTLQGNMQIDLGKGRFIEVETGAGRLMGLFSLRGLVRRLSLDFSDLFGKGFSFDSIRANIAFADGNARTEDLVVDGPVARLELSGRVGLVERDYAQQVVVTPAVGGSLPLAGFIAGGPVGGAAGYLAGKVFERQIGQAAQVRYAITGSWDDPVVEKLPGQQFVLPKEWADQPSDR